MDKALLPVRFENDFEAVLFLQYPVLEEIKLRLIQLNAEAALLSGSGSTLFGVFSDERDARIAEKTMNKEFPKGFVRAVRCA